jgi:metallophosphoesterase superfamily enzyme
MGIELLADSHRLGPFELCHHPAERVGRRDAVGAVGTEPVDSGHRLAGHLHPAVRLRGRAAQAVRLPCFCVTAHQTILPAFGDFTGAATIERVYGETLLAIADDRLFELSDRAAPARSAV